MRICITRSERHTYSETFIRDQISGFSKLAEVFPIHSGRLPERKDDGTLLAGPLFWVLHKIIRGITGRRNTFFGNYAVKKFLQENRIDVVLSNYGISAAHLSPVCVEAGVPLLVIFHGHDATSKKLLHEYKDKYQTLFRQAASIIVVSNDMGKRIIAMGASPAKVQVVPCGVDLEKFKPRNERKERMFLAVGRFVAKKGPLNTINAFHSVWKEHPDVRLVMVGGHKGLYEASAKLVADLGMQEAVNFPGILKQEEISMLMGKALGFVQHSVTALNGDMEGTPVSIMEAGASGLPIVSTLHGGIRDAVVHGKTGYLVEEGDVTGMAKYMMELLNDTPKAAAMGEASRLHIEGNYDQRKQIGKLYALCLQAITKKSV